MTEQQPLGEFLLGVVAAVCRVDPLSIDRRTSLLDIHMDSLTFVSILTQTEAVYGVAFSASDTVDFFGANEIGDLIDAVQRTITRKREIVDESAGNTACTHSRS
jgi:acyl carrier protein